MKKVMQKPLSLLLALLIVLSVFTVVPVTVAGAQIVTDVLTASDFAATGTTYTAFSGVQKNTAVYAGQSAKSTDGAIQLRSNNSNSGIVTTASGGTVKSVKLTVASGSNTVDVYGSLTTSDMRANTGSFGLEYYGSSVVYLTETTLRHYYTIKDQGLYDSVKNNTTFTLDERKLPYVMFDMSDIAANPEPPRDPYEDIIF